MSEALQYINQLNEKKTELANNLVEKGVSANPNEGFNTLIPKVLNIQGSTEGSVIDTLLSSDNEWTMFANMIKALQTGNYDVGTFTLDSYLSNNENVIIDSNIIFRHCFIYATDLEEDLTIPINNKECILFASAIFDEDGNVLTGQSKVLMYMGDTGTGKQIFQSSTSFLPRCDSVVVRDKSLIVKATFNENSQYTPFMKGVTYQWIVW